MVDITDKEKSAICIKCQACCKWVYFPLHPMMGDGLSFFINRGLDVRLHGGTAYVILKQTCQHLTPAGCGIYAIRPRACRTFDGRNDKFMPEMCKWPALTKEE